VAYDIDNPLNGRKSPADPRDPPANGAATPVEVADSPLNDAISPDNPSDSEKSRNSANFTETVEEADTSRQRCPLMDE
jgi:hypothetical protein